MTTLPPALSAGIEHVLRERVGPDEALAEAQPVGGGCVNDARVVTTTSGGRYFLKHNRESPPGLFQAEAAGLNALRGSHGLRVPKVVGHDTGARHGWLLLEYVEPGPETTEYWRSLGRGLSLLHIPSRTLPGFDADNFIGPLSQPNAQSPSWSEFWIERRLRPQLGLAGAAGLLNPEEALWTAALERIGADLHRRDLELADRGGLSLLHGDLWSGNVFPDSEGTPVLIDPAVYLGDPEVDLAMAELFGGFGKAFFATYHAEGRTDPAAGRARIRTYQLYPLLVHANLFGASYASAARSIAMEITRG